MKWFIFSTVIEIALDCIYPIKEKANFDISFVTVCERCSWAEMFSFSTNITDWEYFFLCRSYQYSYV